MAALTSIREAIPKFYQLLARKGSDDAGNFTHVLSVEVMNTGELPGGGGATGAATPTESSSVKQSTSGLNVLSTLAAGSRIGTWFFENQSANTLYVVLDDGSGSDADPTTGTAASKSIFVIAGAAAGSQGGSMGSADVGAHVGRIRVMGAAASQHALRSQ